MKRSSKIALLALFAVIVGCIISVFAFADTTALGVQTKSTEDFEYVGDGWGATASDGTNPQARTVYFQIGGRTGAVTKATSMPYEKNSYAIFTQVDKVGTLTPYIWSTVGSRPTTSDYKTNADDMKNYSYYSFDIDVMAPTGKFVSGSSIDFSARCVNSSGELAIWKNSAISSIVLFGNDTTGSYIYLNGAASTKKYIDPYEFTHITCIIDLDITSSAYNMTTYVYVNGEYFSSKTGTTTTTSYYNSYVHATMLEYRINLTQNVDETQSIAIDNPTFRSYSTSYNGNLASVLSAKNNLYAWESNIYDETTHPTGYFEAVNLTQNKCYRSASAAISEAVDFDTIQIVKDQAEAVSVDKRITVKALDVNGELCAAEVVAADGYTKVELAEGVYEFEPSDLVIFEYVSGGVTKTAGRDGVFADIVTAADADSTVKICEDALIETTASITLSKNLTLDLGGNVVKFATPYKTYLMSINGSKTLNIQNGTLVGEYQEAAAKPGKSYVLFSLSSSSNLILTNVNTYTGMLAWNFSSNNPKITINGGEHHMKIVSTDTVCGFVESRSNVTFTANDATFYCANSGDGLFSSLSYRTNASLTKKSTFTYNNCKIIGESAQTNLIKYSNSYTDVFFNSCEIYGSINPGVHSWDEANGPVKEGGIVIGAGSKLSDNATFSSAVSLESGYKLSTINAVSNIELNYSSGTVAAASFALTKASKPYVLNGEVTKADSYTVNFYAEDGKTLIKTETVLPGATVTPPTYTPKSSNGWYSASYSGWAESLLGTPVTGFTVNKDKNFYPAISGDVSIYPTGAGYNISLLGSVALNLYLPEAPESVTSLRVYDKSGNEIYGERVFLGGEIKNLYVIGEVGATALADNITVTLEFVVGEQTLSREITLSATNYAESVLLDSKAQNKSYSSFAHSLVADMIRYSVSLGEYVKFATGGEVDAKILALYDEYSSLCSTLSGDFTDISEVNKSQLAGYVSTLAYDVSSYQPGYKLTFDKSSSVVDVYITMNGYTTSSDGSNYGKVTYKSSNKVCYSGTKYLSEAYICDIPMYNIDNTVTITVVLENGIIRSGTYNLNGYYNDVVIANGEERALLDTFLLSLRALSASTVDYRYDSVVITKDDAVSFVNCEHTEAEARTVYVTNTIATAEIPTKYCPACDSYLVYYYDFGVVGDGVSNGLLGGEGTNDFAAIREAHTKANAIVKAYPAYNVVVVGQGIEGNNFYIGTTDDSGKAAISVKTNVDWNGAHFIIDDTTVTNKGTGTEYSQSIFVLDPDNPTETITASIPGGIAAGATNIGYAPGKTVMLDITDKCTRHYIRYGANANSGQTQNEVIIVDAYGNVDPTTPVQWDYTNVAFCTYGCTPTDAASDGICDTCAKTIGNSFGAVAYDINDRPLTISGLDKDGNINCVWETITNSDVDVSSYDQFARNIKISRANVTAQGIDRVFVEDDSSYTPRQTYAAFVAVRYACNTVIKDMLITQHLGHNIWIDGVDTHNGLGSYELGANHAINVTWENCVQKNFFKDGGKISYRGMFGSNYLRNGVLKNCILASFDSHSAAYNVTIEDSTFEHINYIGAGEVNMKNVTVYVDGGYSACILRSDYGSMWKGDIKMDGITLRHSSSYSRSYIDLVRAHYNNHYFGYTSYLPGEIYVNNISIEQYNRSTEVYDYANGQIIENNVTTSAKSLGIYNVINAEMKNDYDYSTVNENNLDPKVCTEAIYITNSDVAISYPDHYFFENMKVYIDGVEQDWFTVRAGLHVDENSDGVCDNGCGRDIS